MNENTDDPVLVVQREPDYWSGGHFHEGSKPWIDPTKVWGLPIGTKLYAVLPTGSRIKVDMEEWR